nr:aminotransferase class V-fold PLP-dependent enzyme [Chelativorans xinjiangense]
MSSDNQADWSFYEKSGLTPVINVSGTMTSLGASIAVSRAVEAVAGILPRFVFMHELQRMASDTIAEATGAEAGFITASASAGISLSVAATITGMDAGRAELLPRRPGEKCEAVVQLGHLCNYGAPVGQAAELAGARLVPFGQSTHVLDHQLQAVLGEATACGLYVVSHHVVGYGQMPLPRFAELCHAAGVPVIVDAASEYDLRRFLREGADLVIYSAHKFLGGPTAGIVAGRRDLVRAAYLQNLGIGRGMKVGKESIFGTIAALKAWAARDHDGIRRREAAALALWQKALAGLAGVRAEIVPDPTGNPLDRLRISVDSSAAGASAMAIGVALAGERPAVIVRDHEAELGYIQLDPCNLDAGHAEIVADRLRAVFESAAQGAVEEPDPDQLRNRSASGYLAWLEE